MAATPRGEVLVATKGGTVFQFLTPAAPWSTAAHAAQFPPAFRAAARALLLAAHRGQAAAAGAGQQARAELGSLPQPLLHSVIERAANPRALWIKPPPQPPTAAPAPNAP